MEEIYWNTDNWVADKQDDSMIYDLNWRSFEREKNVYNHARSQEWPRTVNRRLLWLLDNEHQSIVLSGYISTSKFLNSICVLYNGTYLICADFFKMQVSLCLNIYSWCLWPHNILVGRERVGFNYTFWKCVNWSPKCNWAGSYGAFQNRASPTCALPASCL